MSTRSTVAFERESGKIVTSYVHYDGYVTGVGLTLLDEFNSEESARKIANHGDFSSLSSENLSEKSRSSASLFNSVSALSNWLEEKTESGGSVHDLEFAYLWKNGEWYVADLGGEYTNSAEAKRLRASGNSDDMMAYYEGFYKSARWETLDTAFVRAAAENIESLRKRMEKMDSKTASDFEEHIEYLEEKRESIRNKTIRELASEIV